MGVVDMPRRHIRQIVQRAVFFQMALHDVLHRCRHQEILLGQPQRFALAVVIRRIQHLGDDLRHGFLLHRAHIVALIKQRHIHAGRGRPPQPQGGHALAVFACHHHVVGLGDDFGRIFAFNVVVTLVIPPLVDLAAEIHFFRQLRTRQQPAFAAGQPEIRQLGLPAVHQLLAEDAVFVQQRIPDGGHALGGKTVQEAGRQPPESAVAEAGVRLQLIQRVQFNAPLAHHLFGGTGHIQVIQRVFQRTTHQKFHAQIVHLLGVFLVGFADIGDPALAHQIAQHQHQRVVQVFVGRLFRLHRKMVQQLGFQPFGQFFLRGGFERSKAFRRFFGCLWHYPSNPFWLCV